MHEKTRKTSLSKEIPRDLRKRIKFLIFTYLYSARLCLCGTNLPPMQGERGGLLFPPILTAIAY